MAPCGLCVAILSFAGLFLVRAIISILFHFSYLQYISNQLNIIIVTSRLGTKLARLLYEIVLDWRGSHSVAIFFLIHLIVGTASNSLAIYIVAIESLFPVLSSIAFSYRGLSMLVSLIASFSILQQDARRFTNKRLPPSHNIRYYYNRYMYIGCTNILYCRTEGVLHN